jgi:soluble lytic murein transglycosylase-like protein
LIWTPHITITENHSTTSKVCVSRALSARLLKLITKISVFLLRYKIMSKHDNPFRVGHFVDSGGEHMTDFQHNQPTEVYNEIQYRPAYKSALNHSRSEPPVQHDYQSRHDYQLRHDSRRPSDLPALEITFDKRAKSDHKSEYSHQGGDVAANAKLVGHLARKFGVDPALAVAVMLVESSGNHRAVGDNGHSFGLFQLNRRGLLAEAQLTPRQALDQHTNASVALENMRKTMNRADYNSPGQLAAASQRPANRQQYERKVNAMLPHARRLLA